MPLHIIIITIIVVVVKSKKRFVLKDMFLFFSREGRATSWAYFLCDDDYVLIYLYSFENMQKSNITQPDNIRP